MCLSVSDICVFFLSVCLPLSQPSGHFLAIKPSEVLRVTNTEFFALRAAGIFIIGKSDSSATPMNDGAPQPQSQRQRLSGCCFSVLLMKGVDHLSAVPLSTSRGCLPQQVSQAAYKLSDVTSRQPGGSSCWDGDKVRWRPSVALFLPPVC